jgi:hypothetical protein
MLASARPFLGQVPTGRQDIITMGDTKISHGISVSD